MSFAVAQSTSGNGSTTGLTTGKTLTGAPTAGNLLIAFIGLQNTATPTTITWNTGSWTPFERCLDRLDSNQIIVALYRYVQAGDTATMPAFATAGSSFFAYTVQEISGVNGTWANDYQSSRYVNDTNQTSLTTPKDTTRSANCLGLLGFFKYNASANAGLDAGWTSDVNANNFANYGSYGCAHKAIAGIDTDVNATNTFQAGNNPVGMIQVILQTAVPTVPYLVRMRYKMCTGSASIPGTVQFGGAPISGHSLVTFLAWKDGSAADPTIGGSWTQFTSVTQGTGHQLFGLYRDVSGDTDVLAAIASAGSTFWGLTVCEVGGMTGTFTNDKVNTLSGSEGSAATVTTTSDTTTRNTQMALTSFAEYNANANISETGNQYSLFDVFNQLSYGALGLSFDYHATSAGAVQSTWTKGLAADKTAYIQLILGPTTATETSTAGMAFGGIAMSAAASESGGLVGMAFSGITITDVGSIGHGGSIGMAFSGVAYVIAGLRTPKVGNVQIIVVAG